MKQCKRIQRVCAALMVMAVLVGMLSISAFATSGGLDLNGILTAVVAANGGKAAVVEGARQAAETLKQRITLPQAQRPKGHFQQLSAPEGGAVDIGCDDEFHWDSSIKRNVIANSM